MKMFEPIAYPDIPDCGDPTKPEPAVYYLGDVQRLALKPGDVLVLSVKDSIPTNVAMLKERMENLVPGHTCIVLADGMKLGVLSPDRDDAALAARIKRLQRDRII